MKKIAVIGSGISGLAAAYYLQRHHQVTVYEADRRPGGHSHTHDLDISGTTLSVDSGFIVFNDRTYPRFIELLDSLDIASTPTEMSFSVSGHGVEYNGHSLNTLFADRKNLVRPGFLRMVNDILRFNRESRNMSDADRLLDTGAYLDKHRYSQEFCARYLLPMAAAIWSTGTGSITEFPIEALVRFFDHHGLLDLRDRPQWRVIEGGSKTYVNKVVSQLSDLRLSSPVIRIERDKEAVRIVTPETQDSFDYVVVAVHSDQVLSMLADPSPEERSIFRRMKYSRNEAKLHTDARIMPQRQLAWLSHQQQNRSWLMKHNVPS